MFGMCAPYGLRPHEIVQCHIEDETKTGFHIALRYNQRWL